MSMLAPGIHEFAIDVLERLLPAGSRVADVGSGSGAFGARARNAGFDVVLLDLDPADDSVLTADASTDLVEALGPESINAIAALEIVEHLGNPQGFLDQAQQVLRPDGLLLISTPNILHPYSRLKFMLKGTYWLFGRDQFWYTAHSTPFPAWLWVEWLRRAGFQGVEVGYAGAVPGIGARGLLINALTILFRPKGELGADGACTTLFLAARKPQPTVFFPADSSNTGPTFPGTELPDAFAPKWMPHFGHDPDLLATPTLLPVVTYTLPSFKVDEGIGIIELSFQGGHFEHAWLKRRVQKAQLAEAYEPRRPAS